MRRALRKFFAWVALFSILGLHLVPLAAYAQDKAAEAPAAKADE